MEWLRKIRFSVIKQGFFPYELAAFNIENFLKYGKIWQNLKKCLVQVALKTHFFIVSYSIPQIPETRLSGTHSATICEKYYILNNCIIVPNNITQKYKIAFTLNQIRVNSI